MSLPIVVGVGILGNLAVAPVQGAIGDCSLAVRKGDMVLGFASSLNGSWLLGITHASEKDFLEPSACENSVDLARWVIL